MEQLRYSKDEISLCRNTFKGREEVLLAIRNVFFQLPNETELKLSDDVLALVQKAVFPDFNPKAPLFQQASAYFTLGNIKDMNPGVAFIHIQSKDLQMQYLKERFAALCGQEVKDGLDLEALKDMKGQGEENRVVGMLAFLALTNSYIESRLNELQVLANKEELTEEEQKKRDEQNSNK